MGAASAALVAIRDRHRERVARDSGYRSLVATALSAVLVTIVPQPAVAAALAVLVSEHLGRPSASAEQPTYGYDDEQDEYEAYDARRTWASPSSRPPQRLWDGDTYSD